jgi:hypothetical protein
MTTTIVRIDSDNVCILTACGGDAHHEVVSTLQDAVDRWHDVVMLRKYASPGGKTGDIMIIKDPSRLRSPNVAFDPVRKFDAHLLASLGGLSILPVGAVLAQREK